MFIVRQPNAFQSEHLNFSKTQVPQKVDKTNDLLNPVTSNSVPTTKESKVVDNEKVIALECLGFTLLRTPGKKNITTKTIRIQPRSNTKNDRIPSASKSSRIKNKGVELEDHPRNLPLSKNKKHTSSECNNIKLATRNDKYEIVCATCKQCLITKNHDVCVLNFVNGMNFRSKKQKENVSNILNQTKHKAQIWKPINVGSKERLASPKPSKPKMRLRWSPTGKMFDIKGKLIASSESNGDNACTHNPQEPTIKRFSNSTFSLSRVYFVEGLGYNLFSVGQFCDSDLKATFRRNTCFVRNLKVVDLLKRNRTTNLYTINLHDMASASPICLMARATSTKSWLMHQLLSHLNFDTINDFARNDLVTDLPKFKYHKEHLCPSCEQGKRKRAPHPPKPVPNSKQRLYLLHMDLCGPMRITSINGKRYVLMIMDDYSRYNWALCYPKNDREDIGKLGGKGLDLPYALSTITTQKPTEGELDLLFEAMYDDHVGGQPPATSRTVLAAQAPQVLQTIMTTTTTDSAPTPTNSSYQAINILNTSQYVDELETQQHI
uniref:Retrovirus-related Pol polyprotein from transposon TNT 1-94 n=1 Tax=Tanacetum cinerariifolium TaxID=118510 RepID=A0A699H7Z2_TANCI|nr:retrovirus-related Pol polyprotein from transposon TNT 1-94 [Tanacetum cinerariifolium]